MVRPKSLRDSKTSIPSVPADCLIREPLLCILENPDRKAVVVAAGAGYGKTILLAQFASRSSDPCAWYHVDASDNDAMSFLKGLGASVARAAITGGPRGDGF